MRSIASRSAPSTARIKPTTYDALGRVASVANALDTFTYAYTDGTNRVSGISSLKGPKLDLAYYDGTGDELVKQMTYTAGGKTLSQFGYSFNANDNVTKFTQSYLGQQFARLAPAARYHARYGRGCGSEPDPMGAGSLAIRAGGCLGCEGVADGLAADRGLPRGVAGGGRAGIARRAVGAGDRPSGPWRSSRHRSPRLASRRPHAASGGHDDRLRVRTQWQPDCSSRRSSCCCSYGTGDDLSLTTARIA